mmetsp:Transcript_55086/g.156180  ORF Transcript_55086/g.156180 Transcript_55086/m.156180 type:complete len:138 (-) Transcript_55086:194-607(-)
MAAHSQLASASAAAAPAYTPLQLEAAEGTAGSRKSTGLQHPDMFTAQCVSKIPDVKPIPTEATVMCASHCECNAWYWCNEGSDVDPFKSIESYKNCMTTPWSLPLLLLIKVWRSKLDPPLQPLTLGARCYRHHFCPS